MKKLLNLLLVCSFVFLVSSVQANIEVSHDKEQCIKPAVKSVVVLNVETFDFVTYVANADAQYILITINTSNEYVHATEDTKPGHYDYAIFKHRNPGDNLITCRACK